MKNLVFPALGIVAIGLAMGVSYNSVRAKDQIVLSRDYFKRMEAPPGGIGAATTDKQSSPVAGEQKSPQAQVGGDNGLKNPFIAVTLDEAVALYERAQQGDEVVFVDARNDEHFDKAHIPGAVHMDRYNSDQYWEAAKVAITNAEAIVVYCGGGECEDSIYLATELVDLHKIPYAKIRLFEGGMKAWEDDNLETEPEAN